MSIELSTTYDPSEIEDKLYQRWMEKGYFHAEADPDKTPYTIVIPPPNITGQLHMGHALDNMMQDAIIRFRRMQGYAALWLPGTDHASIATEVKIVQQLAEEGLKKEDIGRDAFVDRAWDWRRQYGGRIVEQLKKLGSSCDWSRERFTMDEGCSRAVKEVFVRLYEKGLIYRGSRIINWCPNCKTALSDAEVDYTEADSHLWHIRYTSEDGKMSVVVATTRPETMLGDTAVAVNPNDDRYKDLVGKNVILPLMNRMIPVVADEYVDMEFGTGAVKITPGHDPNDFEVGQRHDLPVIRVMDDAGVINELGGAYAGLDRYAAREKIVEDLKASGELVKIEDHKHNVGGCYRCSTTVEPIVSLQWFVSMKELAQPAIEAVENGDTKFVPDKYSKIFFNWMYNIRDWCISRQLWWGHRIPAYYCEACGEMFVAAEMPDKCSKCGGEHFRQDEDVLDTWFSSGLWPFSTLGWPDNTKDLEFFYPTNVLVTGYDIIFFWVARMIFFGMFVMDKTPFEFVNIHGIVRDAQGRKMSKSLNNGIDPLDVVEKYGADALRFSLAIGIKPGNDMRFYWEKCESSRNFANKIWNASRFVLMNLDGDPGAVDESKIDIADKWVLMRLNSVIAEVTESMEKFDLGIAAQKVYDFAWSEFCDWYIEMAKPRLYGEDKTLKSQTLAVLVLVLKNTLQLLHPFMPFVTEEIYCNLPSTGETIMMSDWPKTQELAYEKEAQAMQDVMELIRSIRNIRTEMNVPPSHKAKLTVLSAQAYEIELCREYIKRLAYASDVNIIRDKSEVPANSVSVVCAIGEAYMPLAELIDIESEVARLKKESENLQGEIKRAQGKLGNPGFVGKAPASVIEEEKGKLAKYEGMLQKVEERIAELGSIRK
ncbi:MAG: valine--tRNA ligase [Eubacteriales bacterium]